VITPQHRHPGHYFGHVLEGTGVVEEDGKPEGSLTPGIVCYTHATADQPVFWHTGWNTSHTRPLRTVSVLIIDKSVPGTVFDELLAAIHFNDREWFGALAQKSIDGCLSVISAAEIA